ncbi:MAG: oligosaccharide flippase family protein [Halobacteriota archaeon]
MEKYSLTVQRIGLVGIANLLIALSGIILLPILTKTLPITSYGSWALIAATISLLPMIASLGLRQTVIRFLAASKDKHEIQEAFYSLVFVVFVAALVVSGPFFILAHTIAASLFNNDVATALIFPLNIFFACLNVFILHFFLVFQQAKKYSALTFLEAYAQVALVALFVLLGYGLLGAVIGLLLEQLFVFFLTMYLILVQIGFAIPKFARTREYLAFGLPLMPGDVSFWIANSSDRYLIGIFLGVAAVGYYSPAYALGATIALISDALTLLLPAVLAKHYDEDRVEDVRTIMKYSLKYYAGIAIPCAFAVSVLSKPLLLVLATPQIAANGYLVTPFVAAGALLLGAYVLFAQVVTLKKKTAYIGTIWVLSAALNFGVNLVLIPYFGIIGAALTTFIAFLLAFVLTAVYSLRQFKFDVNSRFVLKSVCASIVISVFLLLWNPAGLVSVLLSVSLAAVIYIGILFVLRGFAVEEVKFFYRIFKGLLKGAE